MPKKTESEIRQYTFEVRSEKRDDGTSRLSGRPIVYNSYTDIGGWFREVIEQGALDGADLRDVPLLVNHNDRMIPIARSRRNTPNSTMRLFPDGQGLSFEADIDTERNSTARELESAVDRGDMTGMSFRFRVASEKWDDLSSDYPTRHILKFESIEEVSAVTYPAYESTEIYARSKEALDNARSELDNARQLSEARAVETGTNEKELELLKEKTKILIGD